MTIGRPPRAMTGVECQWAISGLSAIRSWVTLLVSIERLGEDVIASENHDDRQIFVNEG